MASSYHLSQLIPRSKISLVCSNPSHCSSIFLYESLATTSNSTHTNPNPSLTPKCQLFYPLCAESCPTFRHLTGCSPPRLLCPPYSWVNYKPLSFPLPRLPTLDTQQFAFIFPFLSILFCSIGTATTKIQALSNSPKLPLEVFVIINSLQPLHFSLTEWRECAKHWLDIAGV